MSLTAILIGQGLVTPEQLRSTIGIHNLRDDQIGDCLLEEGLITGDQLAQALAVFLGVPPALERDFAMADPTLRKRLGARQAEKFRALPLFATQSRRIAVAMVDPGHPEHLHEMGFVLGASVEPRVTSEIILTRKLELLYAMPRRRTTGLHAAATPLENEVMAFPGTALAANPRMTLTPLAVNAESDCQAVAMRSVSVPSARNRGLKTTQAYLASVNDMPLSVPRNPTPPPVAYMEEMLTPVPPMVSVTGPDQAVEQIVGSRDRQEAADHLFAFMRSCFGAGAMFIVNGVFAEGRFGYNQGMACSAVDNLVFSLSLPSCFHAAHAQARLFHGAPPLDGEPIHKALWAALGTVPPKEVVVAPVIAGQHIALLLYGQGRNNGRIERFSVGRLEHVSSALGSALLRLAG